MTESTLVRPASQLDQKIKMWKLEGYDTFDSSTYPIAGEHLTEQDAMRAAQEHLAMIETDQPSEKSGGQEPDGIQDRIYIIRPDGSRFRFSG